MKIEPFDDNKFCKYYIKLFKIIYKLDKVKYLPPRFDSAFKDLALLIVGNRHELLEKTTNMSSSS
jgi:hypothetical protein